MIIIIYSSSKNFDEVLGLHYNGLKLQDNSCNFIENKIIIRLDTKRMVANSRTYCVNEYGTDYSNDDERRWNMPSKTFEKLALDGAVEFRFINI